MTTRPTIMTPKQASDWCNAELAYYARQVYRSELDDANEQLHAANVSGDERVYFWLAVKGRVFKGEKLADAMNAEHKPHNGPNKLEYHNGQPIVAPDLDYWKLV